MIRAPRAALPRAATLASAVFAVLVLASIAALFYAQVLKREAPLLLKPQGWIDTFQPGGNGRQRPREAHFAVRTSVDDVLDVSVVTGGGRRGAVIRTGLPIRRYQHRALSWNGRTSGGTAAPPGVYRLAVRFERAGQTVIAPGFGLLVKAGSG